MCTRKGLAFVLAAITALVMLTGSLATAGEKVLQWYTWGEHAAYREIARAFEERHPGVKVEVTSYAGAGGLEDEVLIPKIVGGVSIDVVEMHYLRTEPMEGMLVPLDGMPGFEEDTQNLIPVLMEAYRQADGHVYAIPQYLNSAGIAYNVTMADKLGLDRSALPKHWSELETWCKRMTDLENGVHASDLIYVAGAVYTPIAIIEGYLATLTGNYVYPMMSEDGTTILGEETGQQVLQHLKDLYERGWTSPQGGGFWESRAGQCWYFTTICVSLWRDAFDFEWDIARYPLMDNAVVDEPVSPEHGGYVNVMPVTASHQPEAWELIRFSMSREGQSCYLKHGFTSARLDLDFENAIRELPLLEKVLYKWAPNLVLVTSKRYNDIERYTFNAYQAIVKGEEPVRTALAKAAEQINRVWQE